MWLRRANGFDSALVLNVKVRDFRFDTPLQNTNRTGSALSIIYTLSFSVSCLSALVAVTCPDTNGGWLSENIYQCCSRLLQNSVQLSFPTEYPRNPSDLRKTIKKYNT